MAKRRLIPIDSLPLVGGAACLDFVNTCGARASMAPRERLLNYSHLLIFARRAGLLDHHGATALTSEMRRRPRAAQQALARARAVRESLYDVLRAAAQRTTPKPACLSRFNRNLAAAAARCQLSLARGVPRWDWRDVRNDLAPMLAALRRV